jgi:large subunit ribosomal protein L9
MKVLLRQDVASLGTVGDIVEVSEGYARNYLLPRHVGVEPTPVNLKRVEQDKVERDLRVKQKLEALKALAAKMGGMSVTIKAKANELGHLFGSVTEEHIVLALAAEGYKVDPSQVALAAPIRTLDKFRVPIRLAEDIQAEIDVWVVPDESAPAPEA